MRVSLKEGNLAQLEEIVQLNHTIFEGMYNGEPYSLEQYRTRLSTVQPIIYIAKSEKALIGDAIAFEQEGSLYLWILGVAREFRMSGIATALLELIENYARERRMKTVSTKVFNVSKEMLRLALKRGYNITHVEEHPSNAAYNAVHLSLSLTQDR